MTVKLEDGDAAPNFTATLTDGSEITLSELLDETGVILYFYPKDSTPGCTTQACDFRDNFAVLQTAGWRVVGVSKDSARSHQNFINKNELPFSLVVDDEMKLHEAYGTWGEKKNYGRTYMGCIRSTFIINQDGTLESAAYNVKATGHVGRILNQLNIQ